MCFLLSNISHGVPVSADDIEVLEDGNFIYEVCGLPASDPDDDFYPNAKKPSRITFSSSPIKVRHRSPRPLISSMFSFVKPASGKFRNSEMFLCYFRLTNCRLINLVYDFFSVV